MAMRGLARRLLARQLHTSTLAPSVYSDSHLDALDRRKRSNSHQVTVVHYSTWHWCTLQYLALLYITVPGTGVHTYGKQ